MNSSDHGSYPGPRWQIADSVSNGVNPPEVVSAHHLQALGTHAEIVEAMDFAGFRI